MRLTLLRSSCQNGRTCPNINATDRNTLVVQGYTTSPSNSEANTATVAVPHTLVSALDMSSPAFFRLDGGTVLVTGERVTDREALAKLALPAGEDAVEVQIAAKEV